MDMCSPSVEPLVHLPKKIYREFEPLKPTANATRSPVFCARDQLYHISWAAILQVTTVHISRRHQPSTLACLFIPRY